MQEQVKATFLVNAAVLLEFRGTKLLIDGIYDENGHCFSNLSERQWEKLKAGEGEFAGIEYLLFTHEHGDHFSPQRVAEYLEYRQPKAMNMAIRLGPSLVTRLCRGPLPLFWNSPRAGARVAEISRIMSISGME